MQTSNGSENTAITRKQRKKLTFKKRIAVKGKISKPSKTVVKLNRYSGCRQEKR